MKNVAAILVLAASMAAFGQTDAAAPKVSIVSKGHDVRLILTDLFAQAKKSCLIQPNIHEDLYLSMENTDLEQALTVICKHANLEWELKDGIYYVRKPHAALKPADPAPVVAKPAELVPDSFLQHRVTTRLFKAGIRTVLETFGKQADVKIEIDPLVPAYKLDALLTNWTLKSALDRVTKAANLVYRKTDHNSILVTSDEKVSLVQ